jgi:hypothetical protein
MNTESYAVYSRHTDIMGNPYYMMYTQGIKTLEQGKRQVINLSRNLRGNQNFEGATTAYVLFKEVKTREEVAVDLDEVLPAQVGPVGNAAPMAIIDDFEDDEGDW